jgi:beta-glucanase (GH16 family)
MHKLLLSTLLIALGVIGCVPEEKTGPDQTGSKVTIPKLGATSPTSYTNMKLVWADEFDGTALNSDFWSFETGNGSNGWGNNELQFYRTQNTSIQDGHLVITAKKEPFGGKEYTSSRIITKSKKEFRYGRVDIRAALPKGQGIWPALWMLGSNFDTVSWPACGKNAKYEGKTTLPSGTFSDQFAVYSITWDATSIRWFVDNKQYHVIDTTPAELDEFRRNFFFIFNVAVGGNWPGSPNTTTTFPQHMIVDYVRVFQSN